MIILIPLTFTYQPLSYISYYKVKDNVIVTAKQKNPQLSSVLLTTILMIPFVLPLGLGLDLYLPSVPSMTSALNVDRVQIQLTLSVFLYCFGIGQLFIGPLSDNFGRRHILLTSLILFILGSLICVNAQVMSLLLLGRILQAFGACGSQVVAFAMIRDQYDGKEATLIYTTLKGAMAIAPIGAPILGAFLQIHYGWQANFIVLSLYGAFILGLAYFSLKETLLHLPKKTLVKESFTSRYLKPYKTILSHVGFLYFCSCGIATQAAMFGYFSLSPRYYISLYGLSESQFALLFSINAMTFLLTSVLMGKWIYRLGLKRTTLIGACLLILSGIIMLFAHASYQHPFVLFLPNLIASASASIMLGASASGAMMPFKHTAGAAAAMFGCMEFIGGGLIGSLAILGEEISVLPLAGCLISLGVIVTFFNRRWQEKEAK